MLRALSLVSLSAMMLSVGCSNNDNGKKPPVGGMPDLATGTGGNDAPDMATAPSTGDMAGPMLPDLAGLPPADHDPTQHPPVPQMDPNSTSSSSTITAPEIYTVVWQGDEALGAKVNTFTSWMLGSDYWKNGVKEYGVGVGSAKGVIVVKAPPPATVTQSDLDNLVGQNVGVTSGWPSQSANLIISVVLDPKTVVVQRVPGKPDQPLSCVAFDGYHSIAQATSTPYLINAYCNNPTTMQPDWDTLTVTISHEAAEATTDYDLQHNRVLMAGSLIPFPQLGGGEDGDMCISLNTKIKADATNTYLVQRLFSNAAAKLNNVNPCLPDDTAPFFGAGLYGNDASNPSHITISRTGGAGTATIKIDPFSYDPSFGPVGFYVVGSLLPKGVSISPDIAVRADPAHPGMKLGMVAYGNPGSTNTFTVNVDSTFTSTGRPSTFLIIARNLAKTRYNIWWGSLDIQ